MVWSMVLHKFKDWKTTKRPTQLVLTGLFTRLRVEINNVHIDVQQYSENALTNILAHHSGIQKK